MRKGEELGSYCDKLDSVQIHVHKWARGVCRSESECLVDVRVCVACEKFTGHDVEGQIRKERCIPILYWSREHVGTRHSVLACAPRTDVTLLIRYITLLRSVESL